MDCFLVKHLNGITARFPVNIEKKDDCQIVSLGAEINYSQIEYVELPLHKETINVGDEGYFIVSSGSREYTSSTDYGIGYFKELPDSEYVLPDGFMPVFGVNHKGVCTVAIAKGMSGDAAQAVTIRNNTYRISVRFYINGENPYEDISVVLYNLKSDATYCDMAKCYRKYQLENGFKPLRERLNPELKYSVESPNIRIRMAWKPVPCTILEQTVENEPPLYVACTFDDVIKVIESYKAAGIEKAEFCLVGWNCKGHDGRWPQILPVESSLGGEAGLKKLIKKAKDYGYQITCHTNSTDAYTISELFDENDITIKKNGEKSIEAERWSSGRTYNLCPKRSYELSMQTLPDVAKLGFRGMHYIDVLTCTPPRVCYSKLHPVNKKESTEYANQLFANIQELFGSAGGEGPYDFALKNCDYALYVSFCDFTDKSSKHILCDKAVPFWQLVYHGIVASNPYARTVNALASNNKDDFLKVIEYGGKPQFYYYAKFVSDGSDWIGDDDIHCNTPEEIARGTKLVKETCDIYNQISDLQYEFIENHAEIAPNVFETVYSDSTVITVDYNTKTYKIKRK